jgi:uncharacterized membrane protein YdjX (TVP38/TMEM64 family)
MLASLRRLLTPRRLLLLLLLGGGVIGIWLIARVLGADLTPAAIRLWLAQFGVWGPLLLIGALATMLVVPLIPATILQIGAGLAFGPLAGLAYVLIADVLGAGLGFWFARRWGASLLIPRLSPESRELLERLIARVSWRSIMLLRLLPGPAYPLVSFAAGLSPIGFGRYTLASFAGVFPALAALVLAGDLVTSSPLLAFALIAAVVAGMALIGRLLERSAPPA